MNTASPESFDVLILTFSEFQFVVLANQISSFESSSAHNNRESLTVSNEPDGCAVDLGEYLDVEQTTSTGVSRRHLQVEVDEKPVVFKVDGALRLARLGRDRFFRLPSVLRDAGCAPWVRGIALLDYDMAFMERGDSITAIWIDLKSLGKAISHT